MNAIAAYATSWPPEGAARFRARAFATEAADLDLDCDALAAPMLVTEVLGRCLRDGDGEAPTSEALWDWSVAERLQGLLAVAQATDGGQVAALATCSDRACAGRIELELGVAGFAIEPVAQVVCDTDDGHRLVCRLPTGADLVAWMREGEGDAQWLAHRLLIEIDGVAQDRLLPGDDRFEDVRRLPETWLSSITAALQDADPLTALSLDVACPFCARSLAVEVDLEALLLAALARRQRMVLEEVHRLASAYHWHEAAIVSMPAWRRRRYLARIQADYE
jgi:hypothetical protein